MPNYLQQGAAVLHFRMQEYAGVSITYWRNSHSVSLVAVPGRVVTDQSTETGAVFREITRDFIIRRTDLQNLDPPKPVRNDEIRQVIDGEEWVFIVNGEGSFISHYEEADSYGIAWRVHTKRDRHA